MLLNTMCHFIIIKVMNNKIYQKKASYLRQRCE